MQSPATGRSPRFLQRLDRLLSDLNVLLAAVAIGLAYLDFVVFATISLSNEIPLQRHDRGIAAFNSAPSTTDRMVSASEAP